MGNEAVSKTFLLSYVFKAKGFSYPEGYESKKEKTILGKIYTFYESVF
jgi:hypothetical protein